MTENRYAEYSTVEDVIYEYGIHAWNSPSYIREDDYAARRDAEARIRELIALENCVALEGVVKDG